MKKLMMSLVCAVAGMALAKTPNLVDLPVSVTNNPMCLSSMTERPWWNEAWTKRVPLLVSGQADETDDKVVVDTIVDFGEPVDPKEVRVVTPWETEVDCVAERVESKSKVEVEGRNELRLLFKTTLRPHQNKPFLVYFGYNGERTLLSVQKGANGQECPFSDLPDVELAETADAFRLRNGVIDVVFDRRHVTEGLIKSLRILGSTCDTVLFDRANGYPKAGFVFQPNAKNGWDKGTVVFDTPLAKTIRFDCKDATLDFTLYAEQPRIDWHYELKGATQASIGINWGIGAGSAFDDFYYCGRSGKILTARAGLDFVTDCIANPQGRFENWLGEGWYAFGERRMADIAGLVFDHRAASYLEYTSWYGTSSQLRLSHRPKKGERASGSGALVATMGDVEAYRRIYRRIVKPVAISVGAVQAKVSKPHRIPRLDSDWCCDYNVGYGYAGDSGTGEPLPKDPSWAASIANRMRSYGSTTVCLMGYNWWDNMPIEDKGVYDRIMAELDTGAFESHVKNRKYPTWEQMKGRGQNLLDYTAAIHAAGMGVHTWCGQVPGWSPAAAGHFSRSVNDLAVDIQSIRVKCGQDCAYSNAIEGEGVRLPNDLVKKNGSVSYWTWKNPQEAFDAFDRQHVLMREFYTKFKAKHPDIPVFLWNSEDGEYGREKFMSEDEGYFDTMVVEMLSHAGISHTKHCAKRMRSHFNNLVGRTVWHHYYIMKPKTEERIWQVEWPFLFGVNGYSQENLTYEATDLETSEVTADFFRFAEYTKLGEKVAKMGPVKNLGVYRDPKMFREDIIRKRFNKPYSDNTQQDGRVHSFAELRNFNYDVIGPKFFTAKDLAQYKVVYVPEDEMISEAEVGELLAYVKNGGSAIIEGAMGEKSKSKVEVEERRTDTLRRTDTPVRSEQESNNSILRLGLGPSTLTLKDSTITPYGKGKILWYKEVRTDRMAKREQKALAEVRKAIADMGGVEPYELKGGWALDGNLQAGPNGMFLGLYNSAHELQKGTVTIGERTLLSVPGVARTDRSVRSPLYVLDVKRGTRQAISSNTFTVAVDPKQCGYFLIGDDAFTAIPAVKPGVWTGPSVGCACPEIRTPSKTDIAGFKPVVAVEFVRAGADGKGHPRSASVRAKYDERIFTEKTYDAKAVKAALAEAKLVHVLGGGAKAAEPMFADCADELKALLKRGGSIVFSMAEAFSREDSGSAAAKFLKEIDVFDPSPSIVNGIGDRNGTWCGPTNHPYLVSCYRTCGKAGTPGEQYWDWKGLCEDFPYRGVYSKWDASKQQSLFRPKLDAEGKYSGLVVQEKVLGAGRVVFNLNERSFGDWYEPKRYGDNFLSWLTGISSKEHAAKVTELNGGLGDVWVK